jgi:hypothetical protein
MSLPVNDTFPGAAAVLPDPPYRQAAITAQTINYDGAGNAKASAVNASFDVFAYDDANTYLPDQKSDVVIGSGLANAANYAETCVRCAGSSTTFGCYVAYTDSVGGATHCELAKWVAGAPTVLTNFATTFTSGDTISIGVVGSLITVYKNGVSIGTFTDTALTSGAAGLGVFNGTANNVLLASWAADNIPATILTGAVASVFPRAALLMPCRPFGPNNPLLEVKYSSPPLAAGGINTPIGLDVAATFSPGMTWLTAHQVALAAVSVFAPAILRSLAAFRALAVSSAFSPALTRGVLYLRSLAVSSTFVSALRRAFTRNLSVSSTFTAAMTAGRAYARSLASTSTLNASLTTAMTYQRAMAVASTFGAALTRAVAHPRTLAVTSTFAVALQKNVGKLLAVTSSFVASMTRGTAYKRTLAVASTYAPSVGRLAAHGIALVVATTWAIAITVGRGFFRTIAAASPFTPSLTKVATHSYFQTLAVASTFTATLTRRATYLRTLATSNAWAVSLTRVAARTCTLAIAPPMVLALRRGVALRLGISSPFVVTLNRGLSRLLAVVSPFLAGLFRGTSALFQGFLTHIQSAFQVRALDAAAFEAEGKPDAAFEVRSIR